MQSRRGGLPGGRRAGPGSGLGLGRREGSDRQPNLFGNTPVNTPQGIGGMTPGRGPGGVMVGGATPPSAGQLVAQGGTTAGFAGQGGGRGRSLQNLFSPQQTPAQGIATIPTIQGVMFGPPTAPTAFSQLMDLPAGLRPGVYGGFPDYPGFPNPLDEDDQSAYESNMNYFDALRMNPTFSNIENFFDIVRDPQIETRFGTISLDPLDPSNVELDTPRGKLQLNIDDEPSLQFTTPLGPQSSLVNPDTSGIMQMAELTEDQKNFMMSPKQSLDFQSKDALFNKIKQLEDTGIFGIGAQEPTTREEFEEFIASPEYQSAFG